MGRRDGPLLHGGGHPPHPDGAGYRRLRRHPPGQGIVPSGGKWLHFDYVPEEQDVRYGSADYTGRLCVIGAQLKEDKLKELFSL